VNPGPPVTLIAVGVIVLVALGGYAIVRRRRMRAAQAGPK
jgi:LPXTG-motif cell wall-anchored protein